MRPASLVAACVLAAPAAACPLCDSAAARDTRAALRTHAPRDAVALLPLAAFAGLAAAVRFAPLPRPEGSP